MKRFIHFVTCHVLWFDHAVTHHQHLGWRCKVCGRKIKMEWRAR